MFLFHVERNGNFTETRFGFRNPSKKYYDAIYHLLGMLLQSIEELKLDEYPSKFTIKKSLFFT